MNKEQMFNDNYKLIHTVIQQMGLYATKEADFDDYFQIGAFGLLKAIDTYDESKGAFSTMACKCIKNELGQHFKKRETLSNKANVTSVSYNIPFKGDEEVEVVNLFADENSMSAFGKIDSVDLHEAINTLNPREREFFEALYYDCVLGEEVRHRQYVTNKLGISVGEYKSLDRAVRKKIASHFGIKFDISKKQQSIDIDSLLG